MAIEQAPDPPTTIALARDAQHVAPGSDAGASASANAISDGHAAFSPFAESVLLPQTFPAPPTDTGDWSATVVVALIGITCLTKLLRLLMD